MREFSNLYIEQEVLGRTNRITSLRYDSDRTEKKLEGDTGKAILYTSYAYITEEEQTDRLHHMPNKIGEVHEQRQTSYLVSH
jgi:hypothetical protein